MPTQSRAQTASASPASLTLSRSSLQAPTSSPSSLGSRLASISGALDLPTRLRQSTSTASPPASGAATPRASGGPRSSPLSPPRGSVIGSPPTEVMANLLAGQDCGCVPEHASRTFIAINFIDQEPPSTARIRSALRELEQNGVEDEDGVFYCWTHTQDFGRMVGLRIHEGGHAQLLDRLLITAKSRSTLEAFKVSKDHYTWFRVDARGPVPADELGPYRFFPRADRVGKNILRTLNDNAVRLEVSKALGLDQNSRNQWLEEGNLLNTTIFSYWKEKAIEKAVSQEFDMYQWHLREINGKSNLGWQREQLYSLSQQLMRQDPGYWLLYALLREDNLMWLISYPYYTKNTKTGDNTVFRHIDLNINNMADGRGINQIQGSLSITGEDVSNCTTLVPGMHKHIKEWRDRLQRRGMLGSGFIQKIDRNTLTDQDLKDFETKWTTVPCKKFTVRITRPEIPHGSTGPSKSVRQTMLPWFVGIGLDHSGLEVEAAGTYEQVAEAHRHQTAPPRSPSGYANMYGAIPYKFPAGVQLEGLGAISDALVGRKRWDDPEVQYEITNLLRGRSAGDIRKYLDQWRKNAIGKFKEAWEKVQTLEEYYFQDKAWGRRSRNTPKPPRPDYAPGDGDVEAGEEGVELERAS